MKNMMKLATAVTLLLASSASMAAEQAHPVPNYIDYMRICMHAYEKAPFAIEGDVALALCQCNSERLPKDGDMTKNEMVAVVKSCGEEHTADPKGFTKRNSEKSYQMIKAAAKKEQAKGK